MFKEISAFASSARKPNPNPNEEKYSPIFSNTNLSNFNVLHGRLKVAAATSSSSQPSPFPFPSAYTSTSTFTGMVMAPVRPDTPADISVSTQAEILNWAYKKIAPMGGMEPSAADSRAVRSWYQEPSGANSLQDLLSRTVANTGKLFPNPADGFRSRVPITTPGFRLQRVPGTGNLAAAARHRWRRTSPAIRFRGTSDERHWKKILLKIKACQPTKIRLQSTNERNFVHISSIMSTDELQEHI
uniref:HDC09393 n=1 Tax=Drosophila melanogaster TaxID=7227 RepID=Q6ILI8_DROME|nr:TPA_inf: HDC09393 [Drosophila melanogaster]